MRALVKDYYDRAVAAIHISVVVNMRTLLDRNNFSSRTNGQVAARRVTGLIIKMLGLNCIFYSATILTFTEYIMMDWCMCVK